MRTTVTLDADTREIIRLRMEREGVSFKRALNDAVRAGAQSSLDDETFRTPTFAMGVPTVDLDCALALAARLEDEEILARAGRGR